MKGLPLLQDGDPAILRYWRQFAATVNYAVLEIIAFFRRIYPFGWVYLLMGLWMAFMLFWAKEFPTALRYFYYLLFFLYLVSLPYMLIYFA